MSTCLALSRTLRSAALLRQPHPSVLPSPLSLGRSVSTSAASFARRVPGNFRFSDSSAPSDRGFNELLANVQPVSEPPVAPSPRLSARFAASDAPEDSQTRWRRDKFAADNARIKAARSEGGGDYKRPSSYGSISDRGPPSDGRYRSSFGDEQRPRSPRDDAPPPRRRYEEDSRREPSYARRPSSDEYERPARQTSSRFDMSDDAPPPRRRYEEDSRREPYVRRPAPDEYERPPRQASHFDNAPPPRRRYDDDERPGRYRPDEGSLPPRRRPSDDDFDRRPSAYGRDDRGPPPRRHFDDDDAAGSYRRPSASYAPRDREDRSMAPPRASYRDDRAPYGREREDRPAYSPREREDRPAYSPRGREDRPAYSPRGREDRPAYSPRERDTRPAYSRDGDSRPAYARDGDSRPAYARDREARPAYSRDSDSRPAYVRDRDARPAYIRGGDERRPASIRESSDRTSVKAPESPKVGRPELDEEQMRKVRLGGRTPAEELEEISRTVYVGNLEKHLSVKGVAMALVQKMPFLAVPKPAESPSDEPQSAGVDSTGETIPLPDLVSAETAAEGGASETVIEAAVETAPAVSTEDASTPTAEATVETAVEAVAAPDAPVEDAVPVKGASEEKEVAVEEGKASEETPAAVAAQSSAEAPDSTVEVLPGRLPPLEKTEMIFSYPDRPEGAVFQVFLHRQRAEKAWGERGWEAHGPLKTKAARQAAAEHNSFTESGFSPSNAGFAIVRFASRELAQQVIAAGGELSQAKQTLKKKTKEMLFQTSTHSFTAARNFRHWSDFEHRKAQTAAAAGGKTSDKTASKSGSSEADFDEDEPVRHQRKPWQPDPEAAKRKSASRFAPRPKSRADGGDEGRPARRELSPHQIRDD